MLSNFTKLEDLELWGGAFYEDGLLELLESIGDRLKRLSLVHIDELDDRALALVTVTCPNLVSFGLHNCEFVEDEAVGPRNHEGGQNGGGEDAFRHRDRMLRLEHEREIADLFQPMLNLRTIKLVSRVSAKYLVLILSQCPNVREIFMGMNTEISDECLAEIMMRNPLADLEEITIQRSKHMTMDGINLLLDNCNKLKVRSTLVSTRIL